MRRSWGSTIAAELVKLGPVLLFGCAAATPPPPETPPTPPPMPPAQPEKKGPDLADPPGAAAGLGPFAPLTVAGAATESAGADGELTQFGKGVLYYVTLATPSGLKEPRCLVAGGESSGCRFLRFAAWKQPKDEAGWRRGATDAAIGPWSALSPAKQDWGAFSAAKDFVYAVRRDSALTIDTIDEKGEVKPFFEPPENAPSLVNVRIVEVAGGVVAIGQGDDPGLTAVPLTKNPAGKWVMGAPAPLKIAMLDGDGVAGAARWMASDGRRVGFGTFGLIPAIDAKGQLERAFNMVWTEAIPPKKYAPRGVVPKKGAVGGAKHGCGGRPSRSLSDASVVKKTHVTLFSMEGKQIKDDVVPVPIPADEVPNVVALPIPGGVEVNGLAFARGGAASKDNKPNAGPALAHITPPAPVGPTLQHLDAAGYDPLGEGIVVFSERDNQLAVRFDARGAIVGAPIDIPNKIQLPGRGITTFARAGETWVALEASGDGVVLVSGLGAGKRVGIASERSFSLPKGQAFILPVDETHVQIVKFVTLPKTYLNELGVGDPVNARGMMLSTVDIAAGTATPWDLATQWFAGESVSPRLAQIVTVVRNADGGMSILGRDSEGGVAVVKRAADGSWSAPVALGEGMARPTVRTHRVWGDLAVELDGNPQHVVTWLGAGLTVPLKPDAGLGAARSAGKTATVEGNLGPLIYRGGFALPAIAGEPIPTSAAEGLYPNCPFAFPTAANRVVLVCGEATDKDRPSARIGVRVLRY